MSKLNDSNRYRLNDKEIKIIMESREKEGAEEVRNVLVISDLHLPFEREGYLEFCKEQYDKYNCNQVVFIGDIIDSHFSSYHETDPDGLGGGDELELCINKAQEWHAAFPDAYVTSGNHDQIIQRKAFSSKVPKQWLKDFNGVLGTPTWKWVTEVYLDDVRYVHGHKSGKPSMASKRDMCSHVSGHYHTDFYINWNFGINHAVFGMAVGTGVNDKEYAFRYAAGGKKSAVGCGVVLDNGQTPILIRMPLGVQSTDKFIVEI